MALIVSLAGGSSAFAATAPAKTAPVVSTASACAAQWRPRRSTSKPARPSYRPARRKPDDLGGRRAPAARRPFDALRRDTFTELFGSAAEDAGQSLSVQAPQAHVLAFTHETLLRQAIGNLLHNAVVHAGDGGV
ncbi:MAG: hypothetical protein Q8M88_06285 [Phenylobacterium sp.]|uniref:hypothetical protein n=1 Tax=Phenylobacterium sp. TaxID=1871053 RepID=UPI002732766D|nr:hypothetical protein [Phenylobacterium sp.]MDP3174025.1 hypothetical protein [Phenylobacterium sp.]